MTIASNPLQSSQVPDVAPLRARWGWIVALGVVVMVIVMLGLLWS